MCGTIQIVWYQWYHQKYFGTKNILVATKRMVPKNISICKICLRCPCISHNLVLAGRVPVGVVHSRKTTGEKARLALHCQIGRTGHRCFLTFPRRTHLSGQCHRACRWNCHWCRHRLPVLGLLTTQSQCCCGHPPDYEVYDAPRLANCRVLVAS